MKIKRTLLPNQPGTKALIERFGKDLICVRYRYDKERNKKVTTAEIIIDETEWKRNEKKIPSNKIMFVAVSYGERDLADLVKSAGGKWNRGKKAWELTYKEVKKLRLEDRLIEMGKDEKKELNEYFSYK
ncbi:MAG TPA: hypothetical protein VMT35_11985 [Ignavibacteriaceae bacterium]|nr:hypothetical protein [Ignavibacteriaceae bacterium]